MSTAVATLPATVVLVKPGLWARVKAEIKLIEQKIEQDEPAVEKVALGVIAIVVPLATTALTIEGGPAAGALVAPIASRVQAGLAALTVAIEDGGTAPTVSSVVGGILSQLSTFESVAGIKDETTIANIGTISTELQTIADAFSSAVPEPTSGTADIQASSVGGFFRAVGHGLKETGKVLGEGAVVGAVVVTHTETQERHVVVVDNARQAMVSRGEAIPLQPGEELLESYPQPDGRVRVVIGRHA